MSNYKISVSKDGKKYNLLLKAENEAIARQRVHDEGYSILTLEKITKREEFGNVFIFEGFNKNKQLKHGKIVGEDILKVYVKLRKNLEYDVLKLYSEKDKNINSDEKKNIIKDLEEEYNLFYSNGKKEKIDELRDKLNKEKREKEKMETFHLKKKLEETNSLIEHVLKKIENIIYNKSGLNINLEKQDKLRFIYNTIIKLKKSTNISKLKEVGEKALLKIGELELKEVEKTKNFKSREYLKETNKLLKSLGSKEQFIEKDKDIRYQLNKFIKKIKNYFNKKDQNIKSIENNSIDKDSHYFMKTKLYLLKYREKKEENTKEILKNFFRFIKDKNYRRSLFLKRSVIKQNIVLLKAKLKGKVYSYTFLKKGLLKINSSIYNFLYIIKFYLFLIIIIYMILFLFYINLNYYFNIFDFNFIGLFLFLIIFIFYILLYISINLVFVIINFVFFGFIIIFLVINF